MDERRREYLDLAQVYSRLGALENATTEHSRQIFAIGERVEMIASKMSTRDDITALTELIRDPASGLVAKVIDHDRRVNALEGIKAKVMGAFWAGSGLSLAGFFAAFWDRIIGAHK